ncbi:MAG: S8 family serine peptidase, partial [Bacteroidales bacterium]|nr:S8 family serine peptidase [Bacteroidales bacterium]
NSYKTGKKIIASFSNYGKTHVDIFAPGVDVYSCIPDNKYESNSGTSMACPSAAGVAALIRSYFPELTASQVKDLLIKTATPYKKKVVIPGKGKEKSHLKNMSVSGGIVNANNAVLDLLNKK